MSRFLLAAGVCLALLTFSCVATAWPKRPLERSPQMVRLLTNFSHVDTWGHPDQFGEYAGIQLFADGRYKTAMKYFKISARYADKASQLAVGLMYTNGRGVRKNPVVGCAWLTLASQRKFPTFIATRNRVCDSLTGAQRVKAAALVSRLLPVYGDKIAKRREMFAIDHARMEEPGSWLDNGVGICANLPIPAGAAFPSGCSDGEGRWSSWRWEPNKYFAARDAYWMSEVNVGALMGNKAQPSVGDSMTTDAGGH